MSSATKLFDTDVPVREGIVMALKDAGIDTVFGLPGGHTSVIFDALHDHRDEIRTVLVREESLAGVMAQVYGRLTGRPGVAIGQAAFLLGASAGALEAHLSSYPLVLLTDISVDGKFAHHGAYQSGSGEYGSWDAQAAYAGFTTRAMVARGSSQTVQAVQLALKHATAVAGGSVALLFPLESLRGRVGPDGVPAVYTASSYSTPDRAVPGEAAIARVVGCIADAQRPVVIAGNGIHRGRAYQQLQRFAEAFALPVVTTAGGKSAIPEIHPLALGVFGNFGGPAANAAVSQADLIIAVGTKLAPSDTANGNPALIDPRRQAIIHVDAEERNIGWTYPVTAALAGDAAVILDLLAASGAASDQVRGDRHDRADSLRLEHGFFAIPDEAATAGLPEMPTLISELARALPSEAIVCADAGENRIFLTHYFQTKSAGSFIQPAGVGAMGYALPAAMAAKLVYPDRPCVAVCGDGGFAMAMNGLLSAIEERIPIVVVVFNNSCLGWVYHGQRGRTIASEFGDFDYAAITRAMGCTSFRASTTADFSAALESALKETDRPAVIEVTVGRERTFLDVTSPLAEWGSR
jgi:acetolactate synthase-1/2/3 large subunit